MGGFPWTEGFYSLLCPLQPFPHWESDACFHPRGQATKQQPTLRRCFSTWPINSEHFPCINSSNLHAFYLCGNWGTEKPFYVIPQLGSDGARIRAKTLELCSWPPHGTASIAWKFQPFPLLWYPKSGQSIPLLSRTLSQRCSITGGWG